MYAVNNLHGVPIERLPVYVIERQYLFEERAAIIEFCGGMDRETAERLARRQMGMPIELYGRMIHCGEMEE